jgi:hypothetical protein
MVRASGPAGQVTDISQTDSRNQPMEEEWEGWHGTGDVEMEQSEEEWAQFNEQT